ncbi:hypothetical protein O181_031704 [Austropuccinia psidii MF-1]|uniref:Uncharacterized protein n=1 Tax=Austropuccinia psidii MF-1 TaxID=1389203 RepID=A0A9Q3CW74_9BASI|nr:hypothetical protein [Austropuccinia psidii MF-1]
MIFVGLNSRISSFVNYRFRSSCHPRIISRNLSSSSNLNRHCLRTHSLVSAPSSRRFTSSYLSSSVDLHYQSHSPLVSSKIPLEPSNDHPTPQKNPISSSEIDINSSSEIDLNSSSEIDLNSSSEVDLNSFYDILMKLNQINTTPPIQSSKPPNSSDSILRPNELFTLLKLNNQNFVDQTNRKVLLNKIEAIQVISSSGLSSQDQRMKESTIEILKTDSPWISLLQSTAHDEDLQDLVKILKLVKNFDQKPNWVLAQTLFSLETDQTLKKASSMKKALMKAAELINISSSDLTHQSKVYNLLYQTSQTSIKAFEAADNYVRQLEKAAKPPSPDVYLQLFNFISHTSMRRSTSIDLFDRIRLLAHPNPPLSIWNALLKALASGASTEPERSMDLFLDLKTNGHNPTVETYNHLIRSMIRARRPAKGTSQRKTQQEKWYFNALRLLKQMIDHDSLRPNLTTFSVLLEGAKRLGDLARAKWTYGLFLKQLQIEQQKPLTIGSELAWVHVQAATSLLQTYASFSPTVKYLLSKSTQGLVKSPLSDPTFFQTLPQTTSEVISEADLIINQFINHSQPINFLPQPACRSDQRKLSFLLTSYLSAYSSHTTIDQLYSRYNAYTSSMKNCNGHGAIRMSWTYLIMLERCEHARSAQKAGLIAREVFTEWELNQDLIKSFELVQSVESRLVSQIWASWIRLQAKYGGAQEAMKEIEKFVKKYPASNRSEEFESKPVLLFQHLELVYHKLKLEEDLSGMRRFKSIIKKYKSFRREAYDQIELQRKQERQRGFQRKWHDVNR